MSNDNQDGFTSNQEIPPSPAENSAEVNNTRQEAEPTPKKDEPKKVTDVRFRRIEAAMNKAGDVKKEGPSFGHAFYDRSPYLKTTEKSPEFRLNFPTATASHISKNVQQTIAALQNIDEETVDWFQGVDDAAKFVTTNDHGVRSMTNKDARFIQSPEYNGRKLVPGNFRRQKKENQQLSTREAVFYTMDALGVGVPSTTPLWSSGWWVSFRPATEDEWVALEDSISSDKSVGLRAVNGLAMSNSSVLTQETILRFAINHIVSTNIRFDTDATPNYLKLLLAPDIDGFLNGFLNACYPNGYPISRKCTAKINECFASQEDNVSFSRLLVADTDRCEERHIAFMARSAEGQVTEKEVLEYQASLPSNQSAAFTIVENENVSFKAHLKVPTAEELINSGLRWNAMLVDLVRNIMGERADDNSRVRLFERQARATKLREYSHWIKEVVLDSNVVPATEAIEKTLEVTSSSDTARNALYSCIDDFMENSRLAIVALPNYVCPSCHGVQSVNPETNEPTNCIPLNVLTTFFHLARLRVLEVMNR